MGSPVAEVPPAPTRSPSNIGALSVRKYSSGPSLVAMSILSMQSASSVKSMETWVEALPRIMQMPWRPVPEKCRFIIA